MNIKMVDLDEIQKEFDWWMMMYLDTAIKDSYNALKFSVDISKGKIYGLLNAAETLGLIDRTENDACFDIINGIYRRIREEVE